ncbi:hypothetical protein NDU88_005665 [Pleurodeles waltl]|uniref:Uncharacterized protein n=1 Tax=Pleurodeles waltl TaxID=8319 RepID=A0AAV7UK63_PLEWA|nr:hypothetical protein NDU88_005665 [Pleurodeles waltl]
MVPSQPTGREQPSARRRPSTKVAREDGELDPATLLQKRGCSRGEVTKSREGKYGKPTLRRQSTEGEKRVEKGNTGETEADSVTEKGKEEEITINQEKVRKEKTSGKEKKEAEEEKSGRDRKGEDTKRVQQKSLTLISLFLFECASQETFETKRNKKKSERQDPIEHHQTKARRNKEENTLTTRATIPLYV